MLIELGKVWADNESKDLLIELPEIHHKDLPKFILSILGKFKGGQR